MTEITIYGRQNCFYCGEAKELAEENNIPYTYFDIEESEEAKNQFRELFPQAKTVPQILLDGEHIGGYTDLYGRLIKEG